MRIAIVSDIHGNYPALERVLEDALRQRVDRFVFIGDYIFDMPYSNEVVRRLMTLENATIIQGNKEERLPHHMAEYDKQAATRQMGAVYRTLEVLEPEVYDFLTGLKQNCRIQLTPGISLYATHWVPELFDIPKNRYNSSKTFHREMRTHPFTHEQYLRGFQEELKSDAYRACFDPIGAQVVVYGHNHLQYQGYCGQTLVINPGSCGQPLDGDNGAAYSILEVEGDSLDVIERRVPYDVEDVIARTKESTMYKSGRIWIELVFLSLRTGLDYFSEYRELARELALAKGDEPGWYFSNDVWEEAYPIFQDRLEQGSFDIINL